MKGEFKILTSLSERHHKFVAAYAGDELEAMQIAGYRGSETYLRLKAQELLGQPLIQEALKMRSRANVELQDMIATRDERLAFWSAIMRNQEPDRREEKDSNGIPLPQGNVPLPTRIKASEILAKAEGDFVEQLHVTGNLTITDIIQKSYGKSLGHEEDDLDLDVIEAEYTRAKEQKTLAAPNSLEDLI